MDISCADNGLDGDRGDRQSVLNAPAREQYVPQFGDVMNAAQVRRQKLYLLGKARNWELAPFANRASSGVT